MSMDETKWEILAVTGFILLDVLTGIVNACRTHELNSTRMRSGFYHKFAYFVVLCVSGFIDFLSDKVDLGYGNAHLFAFCVIFICGIEITSIVENIKLLNPEISNGLLDIFNKPENSPRHAEGKGLTKPGNEE